MKYLCVLAFLLPINLARGEGDWIELFNGTDLSGWTERNRSGSFRVEDGAIVGTAREGLGTTFLCTDEEYGDFELEFECMFLVISGQRI